MSHTHNLPAPDYKDLSDTPEDIACNRMIDLYFERKALLAKQPHLPSLSKSALLGNLSLVGVPTVHLGALVPNHHHIRQLSENAASIITHSTVLTLSGLTLAIGAVCLAGLTNPRQENKKRLHSITKEHDGLVEQYPQWFSNEDLWSKTQTAKRPTSVSVPKLGI